jgi:hypothetical protein
MLEGNVSLWLILGFVLCVAAFAVLTVKERRQASVPSKVRPSALLVFGVMFLVLAFGLRILYSSKSLEALREVVPSEVHRLAFQRASVTKEITDQAAIGEFLALLQTASRVPAHHSYPVDEFNLSYQWRDKQYHYRLGRDSERFEEVWVRTLDETGAGGAPREIGRVQSDRFSQMAEMWLRRGNPH